MKKKVVCIVLAVLILILAAVGTVHLIHRFSANETQSPLTKEKTFRYYPVDYEANIFENKIYLELYRELIFGTQAEAVAFRFEDTDSATGQAKLFLDYFQTVISGKYEEYPRFFYNSKTAPTPRFTMQMIYDAKVILSSVSTVEIDGEEISVENYLVEYKIFQNNGTFRTGVPSDKAVPQIYQIIRNSEDEYMIYGILEIEYVNEAE